MKLRLKLPLKRKYHKNIAIIPSFSGLIPIWLITTCLTILFSIKSQQVQAQDLKYGHWHAAETNYNPAFAGSSGQPRIILNFRDQWPVMPQAYVSYRAAFDAYIEPIRSGLGVYVNQDNQGDGVLQSTDIGMQYMYQARLGYSWALNFGMQFSYQQYRLNWLDLQFLDQINVLYGFNDIFGNPNPTGEPFPGSLTTDFVDLGAGAVLYSDRLYVGMSAAHVTTPKVSFYNNPSSELPMAFSGQAGIFFGGERKDDLVFNPYMLFTTQKGFSQLQTGAYVKKSVVLGGFAVKHNTSNLSDVVFLAGLSKGMLKFAYSYDISVGPLAGLSGGSHEVSLMLTFKDNEGRSKKNSQKSMLDCPSIL
ncbi:MAG: PorP/SprF family type IX secretion system membrane protein [Chitinophagales bacterium]|nr:PorP/SprF family type IX secretion system membrane protein [Chitinophagales bacterium]